MNRIADIIKNRVLFVLLHGKSVQNLENYIMQFKDNDICYASMNYFTELEDSILSKVGKRISILWSSSPQNLVKRMPYVNQFLQRRDKNMLVTHPPALKTFEAQTGVRFIERFRDKIWLDTTPPRNLNSLLFFLPILVEGNPKKIILFGADGSVGGTRDDLVASYYSPIRKWKHVGGIGLVKDTRIFNMTFPEYDSRFNISRIPILNCSPGSHLKPFKIVQYEDLHTHV